MKSYTEEAEKKTAELQSRIDSHIKANFVKDGQGGHWKTIEEIAPGNDLLFYQTAAAHQEHIRAFRQAIENINQQSLVDFVHAGTSHFINSTEDLELYQKIWPLVQRRKLSVIVEKQILHTTQDKFRTDGSLFSFTEPIETETILQFCNCGQFPLQPEEMTERESILATEHLKVCQFIRTETVHGLSAVSKHAVGNWDCKACYKDIELGDHGARQVPSTEWCPRFLRPFRGLTPEQYSELLHNQKSCYAGILHHQVSVETKDGKNYLVKEEMCDTCGYSDIKRTELLTPEVGDEHE